MKIVAVKDTAVNAFEAPFCVRAIGEAVRGFADAVKNPESPISRHPSDYLLFECGEFDSDSGMFETFPPVQIARGADYEG